MRSGENGPLDRKFPDVWDFARRRQGKGLRALRRPRVRRELEQFIELRTPYFGNWGTRTGERTTEMIVLKREQLEAERTVFFPESPGTGKTNALGFAVVFA